MFSGVIGRIDAERILDHLAPMWGFEPLVELRAQCGYVFTDWSRVLKVPLHAEWGQDEVDGLRRFATTARVPIVEAFDPDTGSFIMPYVVGSCPDVLEHLDAICDCVRDIAATPGAAERPPDAWPRVEGPIAPEHADLVASARERATWTPSDLGPNVWRHGDLWHENLLVDAEGRITAIDPVPSVGSILYEAADLATRCLAYQHRRDGLVITRIAECFEIDPDHLASGVVVCATAQVALHYRHGRSWKAEAYTDVIDWLTDP